MLGIDPSSAEYIEAPSTFAKEFRPIYIQPRVQMNFKNTSSDLKRWVESIDDIIDMYYDHKGLVHTANYQLAKVLMSNSRHVTRLVSHTQETRQLTLERFKAMNDNQVLVSPSMTEGIDLPYDACRFQIIAKIPYPNMTDTVWSERFKQNKPRATQIYLQTAIDSVVQAAGRGMRADDDYCETWIIDSNIQRLIQYHTTDFPRFFREAIVAA